MRASLIVPVIVIVGCGGQPPSLAPSQADPDMAAHSVTIVIPQSGSAPCVPAAVVDPPVDCHVLEIQRDESGAVIASDPVAKCSDPGGRSPCWEIGPASPTCPNGQLSLGRTAPPPPATTDEAICALH